MIWNYGDILIYLNAIFLLSFVFDFPRFALNKFIHLKYSSTSSSRNQKNISQSISQSVSQLVGMDGSNICDDSTYYTVLQRIMFLCFIFKLPLTVTHSFLQLFQFLGSVTDR
jgi:hypothetical protein